MIPVPPFNGATDHPGKCLAIQWHYCHLQARLQVPRQDEEEEPTSASWPFPEATWGQPGMCRGLRPSPGHAAHDQDLASPTEAE